MTQTPESPGPGQVSGWNPYTGQRVFRSARQAWMIYGKYRFSISERTFYTYVGYGKLCPPRPDTSFYVEDIEIFAQSQAWPLTSLFVRGEKKGGEGESGPDYEINEKIQIDKWRKIKADADSAEIDVRKKLGELLPRSEYEQRLAAAAAVVGTEAETFVYDNVREIIHLCGGNPDKEDSLREFLLDKVRGWLHAFSANEVYEVDFIDDDDNDNEGSACHAADTGNVD